MIAAAALLFLAAAPPTTASIKVRVIHGNNNSTILDPKISDLFGLLKNFAYTSYYLKEQSDMQLVIDGAAVTQKLPSNKQLHIAAKDYRVKKGKGQVQIELEIPESKFKTKVAIMAGATLVIGGPKFEDGVLFFVLTLSP